MDRIFFGFQLKEEEKDEEVYYGEYVILFNNSLRDL